MVDERQTDEKNWRRWWKVQVYEFGKNEKMF